MFSVAGPSAASDAPQSAVVMLEPPPLTPASLRGPIGIGEAPSPSLTPRLVYAPAPRDVDCLARAVYYEARGESDEGQAAVAQVVMNRVHAPSFPKSVCGVVFQGVGTRACQFSFACGRRGAPSERQAWTRAIGVARRALGGYVLAAVGRATSFHAVRAGAVFGLAPVARIGSHVFFADYRPPRGASPSDIRD